MFNTLKWLAGLCLFCITINLVGCESKREISIGTTPGLYTDLLLFAANNALQKHNLTIHIKQMPATELNTALEDGKIDATFFQTNKAFKLYQQATRGSGRTALKSYGRTYITPMSLYSKTKSTSYQLASGDTIFVGQELLRQSMALQLLSNLGLIRLKQNTDNLLYNLDNVLINPTVAIQIQAVNMSELTAAEASKSTAIVLYPNQALALGYRQTQTLFTGDQDFSNALILVSRAQISQQLQIKLSIVLTALHSQSVQDSIPNLLHYALEKAF